MKKFYKYLLLIVSLLLSSCKDRSVYFDYDEMIEKVVKIEVVDANGGDHISSRTYKYLFTLNNALIDDFLLDLSQIEFAKVILYNGNRPWKITFIIYYRGGDYDYINLSVSTCNNYFVGLSTEDYNYLVDKYYYQII